MVSIAVTRTRAGLLVLAALVPSPAAALQLEAELAAGAPEMRTELEKRIAQDVGGDRLGRMILTGASAGAVAIGIGWFAGREITDSNEGGFLTAAALGSGGIPLGVHWGNGSRGELPLSLVASYGIGLVGLIVVGSQWTDASVRTGAVLFPLAQLASSMWIHMKAFRP